MTRLILLFLCLAAFATSKAQNIYAALHLNEETDYKTKRPKKIIETNTFFNKSGKTIQKNIKLFDEAGMIISEERFDRDDNQTAKLTYTNDTVNRITLSRIFYRKTSIGPMTRRTDF